MKQLFRVLMIFLGILILFSTGCQKEDTTQTAASQPGDSNSTEGSLLIGDRTFEGLNGFMDNYFAASGLKSGTLSCPSIALSQITSFPITITLDWGTGCTGSYDGITRSGEITVSLSGLMSEVNSVATFSFTDFVTEGYKITGVHKITYLGLTDGNNWPKYGVFTEARIEFPDKKFITYRAEYIRLKSEGASTTAWEDDVWRIEGNSSGVTREGIAWTASYPSAVVKKNSCKYFSSGSVTITPEGLAPRIINFGDGTCDNKATLTIGDQTIDLQL